ncbi:PREDICTED: S phase cyclin A-associated protein in the endoplasmic reticulum isoform X1 [Drosophila arizonae]|uniref:S phase cyclin A-associated protein in the endoplasmic reticulum isoform X1 n=2 Tax=Drosophila arizonae TaxID=7263 RepID=A0ABM1NWZ5_DROAR|nr:PREDICTED: S phase cyclin A-associated protein in the endoplasmic reticulum isoform X1 [Drosophila arizonae]
MEMREVLSREGREAKNLLVYQFCDETTASGVGVGAGRDGAVINGDCYPTPTSRKPPMAPPKSPNGMQTPKHCQSPTTTGAAARSKPGSAGLAGSSGPRVRSASTGRDKKSELQARYWALLFGNLQRAVNEIYQTVECYENISSCQEAILVLENYVRDFKALSEWFKVSWDYESRPVQQRPHSLAWEVRKSNPTPRVRTKSLCSPTASGKSSPALFPCNSGKTSPCCDGHVTPKKLLRACDPLPRGAMRVNVRELFSSNKSRNARGSPNSDVQEVQEMQEVQEVHELQTPQLELQPPQLELQPPQLELQTPQLELQTPHLELQTPQLDLSDDKSYVELNTQYSQTDLEDPHLTLADLREKMAREKEEREAAEREKAEQELAEKEAAAKEIADQVAAEQEAAEQDATEQERKVTEAEAAVKQLAGLPAAQPAIQPAIQPAAFAETQQPAVNVPLPEHIPQPPLAPAATPLAVVEPTAVQLTVSRLDAMENVLLHAQANKQPTPPNTLLKPVAALPERRQPEKLQQLSNAPAMQNSPLKYSSVLNRPAAMRGSTPRANVPPMSAAAANSKLAYSKPGAKAAAPLNGLRRSSNNNANNNNAKPFVTRSARLAAAQPPPRPASKAECYGPPNNVATRLSARSRTMLDMNGNAVGAAAAAAVMPRPSLSRRVGSQLNVTGASGASNPNLGKRASAPTVRLSSREDIASSTSTLKASNEQLSSSRSTLKLEERHSEPKQLMDANDGWHTVKNRRRTSMHWSNRFNQPTGYASLPTLALLNEQKEEKDKQQREKAAAAAAAAAASKAGQASSKPKATAAETKAKAGQKAAKVMAPPASRPEIKNAKAKVNSFPAQRAGAQIKKQDNQQEKHKDKELEKSKENDNDKEKEKGKDKGNEKHKEKEKSKPATALTRSSSNFTQNNTASAANARATIIKRQKSDLTGLKMTSLHKEYMRSEKNALRKQQKEQQEQSKGNNAQATDNESNNDDHNKIDIKIQTNCEFSKTIGELYESIARCKLPNGCVKPNASLLAACDEIEEQTAEDVEEERNERILVEVQESLERQIRELESTEIDVDTETDETDGEVQLEEQDDSTDQALDDAVVFVTMSDDENASLELRYQALLSDMSWNERAEALATLQAYVARHPGRAQELHQKLSSPSRRRSLQETLKKYQAKQARAQQKRALLQQEKAAKLQQLFVRVEDVKAAKKQLIEDKRLKMEGRLQRAAENRELYLRQIIEKAHDEDKKLKEINFIKNIEAQNKRLDLLEAFKETEGRLQDLEQERQKRVEEKAAKEAAVERRRQALEKERLLKLEKMNETRLEKEQRIGKMQEQKERQRQALAREKARDREERLLALQVQQQQTTEELQRKIQQKQLESARRHEENIEHIRQRALELTLPSTRQQDEARGDEEPELLNGNTTSTTEDCDMSSTLSDIGGVAGSREHSRSYKKKMKKLKQRMNQCAADYLATLEPLPAHVKRDSSVPKLLNLVMKGGGNQGLDRTLGNLLRVIPKAQTYDFQAFLNMDGLGVLTNYVISKGLEENSEISKKSVTLAVQLYRNACSVCPQIARHALLGNSIATLFDAISKSFQLPEEKSPQHPVELSTELMLACTEALSSSYVKKNTHPKVPERLPDMINYAVITGLIGMLSRRCMKVRESIEQNQSVMLSLLTTLGFLTRFIDVCAPGPGDPTRLLSAAKSTELFGTVAMLSGCVVPIGECIPPRTTALAASTFNLFVSLASVDSNTFQEVLSVEGPLSLKLLDVMSLILKYSVNQATANARAESSTMLIDLIATLAFFSVNNRRHQELLISEPFAVIFKNLSKLPTQFNPVIYPFLVTMCYNNAPARQVISRDFDLGFLDEYSRSDAAKRNRLIQMMHDKGNNSNNNSSSNNKNSNNNNNQQK